MDRLNSIFVDTFLILKIGIMGREERDMKCIFSLLFYYWFYFVYSFRRRAVDEVLSSRFDINALSDIIEVLLQILTVHFFRLAFYNI